MLENRHFKVIVAVDNAEELMLKYDPATKVAPYVVFEYKKAAEYKANYLKSVKSVVNLYENELRKNPDTPYLKERIQYFKEEIDEIETESDDDFYFGLVEGYDVDEETLDASTTENPDTKFSSHKIGGGFSLPFILKDTETEVYKARKGDIDWDKIHLANTRAYEVAWDTTHGLAEPNGEDEEAIYQNMKNRMAYFENFESREHYIASMTAFWALAFVDKSGWYELGCKQKQFDWVVNFYDRFIKPLPDDTLLTIYECVRPIDA
jgi:hypothetical protein